MAHLSKFIRLAGLSLALASGLAAQEGPGFAFKMGGGPVEGGARKLMGDAGMTFGATFEVTQPLGKDAGLVYSLGYQTYPGDNKLLSFIPTAIAATGVNPSYYETRNRLNEGAGWVIGAVYRKDVWMDGFYLQGGLKLGAMKVTTTDTGTRLTTNGGAIANTNSATPSGNILAIDAIATKLEKKITSVSVTAGAGYRLTDRYALELNLSTLNFEGAVDGKKSGMSAEVSFSVRF